MPPKKKYAFGRRENDLGTLIDRLEVLAVEIEPENNKDPDEDLDEFTRLKKLAARQVQEIRKMISERDELLDASSGSGGRQSVQLSAKIRETIKAAHETHKAMQNQLSQEERDVQKKGDKALLSKDEVEDHVAVVDLTGKHLSECEGLEKRRYQTRTGNRQGLMTGRTGGAPMSEIKRSAQATELDDIDPEVGEGLTQIRRNDQMLDNQLDVVSQGLVRLKGIAVDQQNELKLQEVMIEQIDQNMDQATGQMQNVNHKMKDVLQQAGGATTILIKICLLILLVAVFAYLYRMIA